MEFDRREQRRRADFRRLTLVSDSKDAPTRSSAEVSSMISRFACLLVLCGGLFGQQSSQPSLTISNQDFAVVRQDLPLDLKSGENQVHVNDITMHLEPDSVILRDPSGKRAVRVVEHLYRALHWNITSNSDDYKKTTYTARYPG
jgi:hypothetical protein